MQVTEFGV